MALTYEQSSNLMNDMTFRGRIKVAAMKFTTYVFGEDPNSQGHAARYRWGQSFVGQPDIMSASLQPVVVMDPTVQDKGAAVSDAELQGAVEGVINKIA